VRTRFEQQCNDAMHARSLDDLLRQMVAFSEDRGFGRVSATVITDHSPTLREYQFITNASAAYLPEFEDLDAAHVDPVSQHAATKSTPLLWAQSTYVAVARERRGAAVVAVDTRVDVGRRMRVTLDGDLDRACDAS
jgi:hypothetical protein